MNMLNTLLPGVRNLPQLDPLSSAGKCVAELKNALHALAMKTDETLEVVPADHEAYVFIGDPGKRFDLAWIHDDQVSSLGDLLDEHGFTDAEVGELVDMIRESYQHHAGDDRYSVEVNDRTFTVTPSNALQLDLHDFMEQVIHH